MSSALEPPIGDTLVNMFGQVNPVAGAMELRSCVAFRGPEPPPAYRKLEIVLG